MLIKKLYKSISVSKQSKICIFNIYTHTNILFKINYIIVNKLFMIYV